MSSASPRRTAPQHGYGLPLNTFLSLLDWATESPCTAQKSCIACKSQESTSDQLPISIDCLRTKAGFCVAKCHQLLFSSSHPSRRLPAVLSIEDGSVRLCLDTGSTGKRCLVIDLTKLVSPPALNHTEDMLCLQFMFPFVSLLLERPRRDIGMNHEAARTRELQFAAMKEAVVELCHMPASSDQETGQGVRTDVSLFTKALREVCEREEIEKVSLGDAFVDLMNRGAEMVMPVCFPYNRRAVPASAVGNTSADHSAFVDAYMNQEAVWRRTIEQVDAALYFAKRRSNKRKENDGEHTGETDEIERVEALNGAWKPA